MAAQEARVYLETAHDQLRDARRALRAKSYALCVFLSASSAENAASALVITFGAKPSTKHRNSLVLHRLLPGLSATTRAVATTAVEGLKSLEPHITKARYPVLVGTELAPPAKFYTEEAARSALAHAREVVETARRFIRKP